MEPETVVIDEEERRSEPRPSVREPDPDVDELKTELLRSLEQIETAG